MAVTGTTISKKLPLERWSAMLRACRRCFATGCYAFFTGSRPRRPPPPRSRGSSRSLTASPNMFRL